MSSVTNDIFFKYASHERRGQRSLLIRHCNKSLHNLLTSSVERIGGRPRLLHASCRGRHSITFLVHLLSLKLTLNMERSMVHLAT